MAPAVAKKMGDISFKLPFPDGRRPPVDGCVQTFLCRVRDASHIFVARWAVTNNAAMCG
jgi:hypothetical protein